MERYSEYKDSGVKWLGEIPSHWEVRKIIGCFSENKKKNTNFTYTHAMQFNYGTIVDKNEGFDTTEAKSIYSNYALINKGDIVINGLNLNYDFISQRVAISPKDGIITSAYVVISPRENVNPYYFCYLFKDMDNMKMFHGMGSGVRKTLSFKELRNQLIPIPTVEEQNAIVRYLDAATSKIDKAIAMQQKMIDLLNERKQIIIQNAVTKGLDENVEMKDSGDRWIGLFPSSWTTRRLNFSSWIRARLGWKGLKASEYVDNGYPFLSAFNIVNDKIKWENLNFINKYRYDESPEIKLSVGDILLVKDGAGIGKCARIDELPCGESTANGSLAVITANYFVDYCYLYYFMISKSFKDHTELLINGMGVPHFTQGEMKKIVIPIPSKSEQQAIVAYLDKEMQRFDSAISNCQRQITLLQERKQIIINEVVTGKVKVS